jgi:hypothetical protein
MTLTLFADFSYSPQIKVHNEKQVHFGTADFARIPRLCEYGIPVSDAANRPNNAVELTAPDRKTKRVIQVYQQTGRLLLRVCLFELNLHILSQLKKQIFGSKDEAP